MKRWHLLLAILLLVTFCFWVPSLFRGLTAVQWPWEATPEPPPPPEGETEGTETEAPPEDVCDLGEIAVVIADSYEDGVTREDLLDLAAQADELGCENIAAELYLRAAGLAGATATATPEVETLPIETPTSTPTSTPPPPPPEGTETGPLDGCTTLPVDDFAKCEVLTDEHFDGIEVAVPPAGRDVRVAAWWKLAVNGVRQANCVGVWGTKPGHYDVEGVGRYRIWVLPEGFDEAGLRVWWQDIVQVEAGETCTYTWKDVSPVR